MVLADCADDAACSYLTVSTMGPEVSCDFYSWSRDNFACMTSDQVSCNNCRQLYAFPLCQTFSRVSEEAVRWSLGLKTVKGVRLGITAVRAREAKQEECSI